MKRNTELFGRARDAWAALAPLRCRRERYKSFAYGRQWDDTFTAPDGRVFTEEYAMRLQGRSPVTNNLIRQLLKTIVGRYRYLLSGHDDEGNPLLLGGDSVSDTDARALEEFLISGMVVQRVSSRGVENVSPSAIFFTRPDRADASDCRFLGCLHDLPVVEILRRHSGGDLDRAKEIIAAYSSGSAPAVPVGDVADVADFSSSDRQGYGRVIEVWSREPLMSLLVRDPLKGEFCRVAWDDEAEAGVRRINRRRKKRGLTEIVHTFDCSEVWTQAWMGPRGEVFASRTFPADTPLPYVMRMYPYIDGEIHSLVEDVIGQQKYVNRLVTLLDDIIAQSGKGVLLFPMDQLPDGFTWGDLRRLWANPGGIVPYRRTSKTAVPQQIHTTGRSEGASEMLRLQLKLFDEVAGVAGTMRGQSAGTRGAESLRREMENSTVGMLDLLGVFREFTRCRDALKQRLSKN